MAKELLPLDNVKLNHDSIAALFLGPKAENFALLKELFEKVLGKQRRARENYHPDDKVVLTIQCSPRRVTDLSYRFSFQKK